MAQTETRTIRIRSKTSAGGGGNTFLPTSGKVKTVSSNTIMDVRQSPYPITYGNYLSGDPENKWDQSSTVYNQYGGTAGSLEVAGIGGHGADQATDAFRFPLSLTAMSAWERRMNTYPDPGTRRIVNGQTITWYTDNEGTNFAKEFCEYLVNGQAGQWYGYTPSTVHTRNCQSVAKGGTNNQGILIHPYTTTIGGSGGPSTTYIHTLDLGVNNPTFNPNIIHWSRGPKWPVITAPFNGDFSWYDESMNCYGLCGVNADAYIVNIYKYDLTTGVASIWAESDPWGVVYMTRDSGGCYIEHRKLLLLFNMMSNATYLRVTAIDLAGIYSKPNKTNLFFKATQDLNCVNRPTLRYAPVTNPTTGVVTNDVDYPCSGYSMDLNPVDGALYGMLANPWYTKHRIFRLKPSLNLMDPAVTNTQLMNDTWTFTELTDGFTGDPIQSSVRVGTDTAYNHLGYNAFRHVKAAPGVFVWHNGIDKPVQLINPTGM